VGNTPKKALSKQQRAAAIIIIAAAMIVVYALVAVSVMPLRNDIKAGQVSPITIPASRDIVDKVSTEALREEARLKVTPVYAIDSAITQQTGQSVAGYFDSIAQSAAYLRNAFVEDKAAATGTSKDSFLINTTRRLWTGRRLYGPSIYRI
jgi:membrane-associated HD superfamily phosphohydrolase